MPNIFNSAQKKTVALGHGIARRRVDRSPVPRKYANRPTQVRQAIRAAHDLSIEFGLSPSVICVLKSLIATGLNLGDLATPVFARKSTIGKLAEVSDVSVYRALNKLQQHNFIVREKQQQLVDGSLDITEIKFTELLLVRLGCQPSVQDVVKAELVDVPETLPVEAAHIEDVVLMKDGKTDVTYIGIEKIDPKTSVITSSGKEDFIQIEGRKVPPQLAWMAEEKIMSLPQIFLLMKRAGQIDQRLEDYVHLRKDRLLALKTGNDRFCYLRKLISEKVDARHMNTLKTKRTHSQIRSQQKKLAMETRSIFIRQIDSKTYCRPGSNLTFTVNATSGVVIIGNSGNPLQVPNRVINSKFINMVKTGALVRFIQPQADCETVLRHAASLLKKLKSTS